MSKLRKKFKIKHLLIISAIFFLLSSLGVSFKIVKWKAYIWLPAYFLNKFHNQDEGRSEETHIIFLFCDHFEPGFGGVDGETQKTRVNYWCKNYRKLIQGHKDSNGYLPRHTWFYPYDEHCEYVIKRLNNLVYDGLGEIEFHLHHSNDTFESLTKKLEDGLNWFNRFGAMLTAEEVPQKKFAFIHGMFALDNSSYGEEYGDYCGVNNELEILKETGCYADFTFSTIGNSAQPSKINSIYYALDTPEPKSYDNGIEVKVEGKPRGDLMIFEGPIGLIFDRRLFEFGSLDLPPRKSRVDAWIRANVHVRGRPEWIFVKVYAHSAYTSRNIMFSEAMDEMFEYLETKYNSPPFILHYVTAREAYNIVKAAEAGLEDNPNKYRNYLIKPPINTKIYSNAKYYLHSYAENCIKLKILEKDRIVKLKFKEISITSIEGNILSLMLLRKTKGWQVIAEGKGELKVVSKEPILNGNLLLKKDGIFYYSVKCEE